MKSESCHNRHFFKVLLPLFIVFSVHAYNYGQEEMQDAVVKLSFTEDAGVKTIQATATDQDGIPIEDLELFFYVQRTFSLLPIGDAFNATDENGVVEVLFPEDLPGDTEGHVKIVVKIMESDMYNDLTLEVIKNWGIPSPLDQLEEKRSLWAAAANAPITLVLATSSMILAIWFIIGYIIFILFKIGKIKVANS